MRILPAGPEKVQYYRLDYATTSAAERGMNAGKSKMAALHHEIGKSLAREHIEGYPGPAGNRPPIDEQYAQVLTDIGFFALDKAERFHRRNRRVAARDIGLGIGKAIATAAAAPRANMLDNYFKVVNERFAQPATTITEDMKTALLPASLRGGVAEPSQALSDVPFQEQPAAVFAEIYGRMADEATGDISYCAVGGLMVAATFETTLVTLAKEATVFHAAAEQVKALAPPIQAA
jgi:hypothetical protein